jgi:hypothetical protein
LDCQHGVHQKGKETRMTVFATTITHLEEYDETKSRLAAGFA